jgi:hypothetical protein
MSNLPVTNPLSNLTMNDMKAVSSMYGGLAKSARFAVRIAPAKLHLEANYGPFLRDFTYLCEAAEMPGRGFLSLDVRYYGPNQKLPYQTQYEDTTMTFLCRSESFERQFFDDWMEMINPTNSFDFSYRSDYETTIEIMQLAEYSAEAVVGPNQPGANRKPKETYRITLYNAYPTLINPQPVTWADDQFQRLAVTFTYHKWRRAGYDPAVTSNPDLVKGKTNIMRGTTPNRE